MEKGLYQKYIVTKANGKPLDPNFHAIVLRIDGGQYVEACRMGASAFAKAVEPLNKTLAFDIQMELLGYIAREKRPDKFLFDKQSEQLEGE